MPWARESLAGSLREKFPEAAVMETAQRWAGRGSEPGTQMGKGWEETSWETREETQPRCLLHDGTWANAASQKASKCLCPAS